MKRRPTLGFLIYSFGWVLVFLGTVSIFAILLSLDSGVPWFTNPILIGAYYFFWILALLFCPFSVRIMQRGRRLFKEDALSLLQRDKRAPILLLRSFEDDTLYDPSIRPISFRIRFNRSRYEESLSRAFQSLGPFVTIGKPGEPVPETGASRLYVNDQQWTEAVDFFLRYSSAVVIIVGRSKGVWWEIETVLRRVQKERILFFFPYVESKSSRESTLRTFYLFFRGKTYTKKTLAVMGGERQQRYALFRQRAENILATTANNGMKRIVSLAGHFRLCRAFHCSAAPPIKRKRNHVNKHHPASPRAPCDA